MRNNFLHLFSYIVYAIFSVITSQICCSGRVNSSLKSGESYGNMKKSIVVSIIESKLFPKDIGCHSIFSVREQNTGHRLCDRLEFHFLELGKVDPRKPLEEICVEFIQLEVIAENTGLSCEEVKNWRMSSSRNSMSILSIPAAKRFVCSTALRLSVSLRRPHRLHPPRGQTHC